MLLRFSAPAGVDDGTSSAVFLLLEADFDFLAGGGLGAFSSANKQHHNCQLMCCMTLRGRAGGRTVVLRLLGLVRLGILAGDLRGHVVVVVLVLLVIVVSEGRSERGRDAALGDLGRARAQGQRAPTISKGRYGGVGPTRGAYSILVGLDTSLVRNHVALVTVGVHLC